MTATYPYETRLMRITDYDEDSWIEEVGEETYRKMLDAERTNSLVTVEFCAVDSGEPHASYYDVHLQDGTRIDALHALHLVLIPSAS
jgi:hypothetical protein